MHSARWGWREIENRGYGSQGHKRYWTGEELSPTMVICTGTRNTSAFFKSMWKTFSSRLTPCHGPSNLLTLTTLRKKKNRHLLSVSPLFGTSMTQPRLSKQLIKHHFSVLDHGKGWRSWVQPRLYGSRLIGLSKPSLSHPYPESHQNRRYWS
jgi:hypothetical protein